MLALALVLKLVEGRVAGVEMQRFFVRSSCRLEHLRTHRVRGQRLRIRR